MKWLMIITLFLSQTLLGAIDLENVTDEKGWGVISSPIATVYNTKGKEVDVVNGGDFFFVIKEDSVKINGEPALYVSFRKLEGKPAYVVYAKDCFVHHSCAPDKDEDPVAYKAELKLRSTVISYFKTYAQRHELYTSAYKKHIKGSPVEAIEKSKKELMKKHKELAQLAKDLETFKKKMKQNISSAEHIRLVDKGRELRADANRLPAEIDSLEERIKDQEAKALQWEQRNPMKTDALYASQKWKRFTIKLEEIEAELFESGLSIPSSIGEK